MAALVIQDFSGMMPLRNALLLPDRNAAYSKNTWMYKGEIRGFRQAASVYTLLYTDTKQVYRIPSSLAQPPDYVNSQWLEFPDPFMSVIRNPVVGDQWNRYYFFPSDQYNSTGVNPDWPTGGPDSSVPMYRTYIGGTLGPLLLLGIPTPSTAVTVTGAPTIITLTASAPTYPGGVTNVLHFSSTTDVSVGMTADDVTDASAGFNTNAPTNQGDVTLFFASTTYIYVGETIKDISTPTNIADGTTVTVVGPTSVDMSIGALGNIPSTEFIGFYNINPIPPGTFVTSLTATTVTLSGGITGAGVISGDQVVFRTPVPEIRAYVYTYISAYGEEGPASPPSTLVTGDPNGSWTVVIPAPDAGITTNRNLAKIRLYRTVTDSSGNAQYYEVTEFGPPFPTTSTTFTDTALDTAIVNNVVLSSELYTPPPADLQGVVMMANGIAAGFSNQREVWFSAAYLPHAWPESYAITVDYPIVGMTANGASLNILTEGAPFIATGVTPDTMTIGKITANEPCIGRGSIVSSGEGAFYASPNGIMLVNTSGVMPITEQVYEKEFHNALLPYNWASGRNGMSYVAFFKGAGLPGIDPDGNLLNGMILDRADKNVPFSYLQFASSIINMYFDETSGQLFEIQSNNSVVQWNPTIAAPGTMLESYVWKSKEFRLPFPASLKAFQFIFSVPPEVTITLGPRNNDQAQVFDPTSQYFIVKIYADKRFVVVREYQNNEEVILIPDSFKAIIWEFEIIGQVNIKFFKAATSVKELRKV